MCNATGGNEFSETIPILHTKISILDKTECYFCQSGMSTNYYCTAECDNVQRSLDGKRLCGDAFFLSVDILESTIKNMKVKELKGELKSRRLLQGGKEVELQD